MERRSLPQLLAGMPAQRPRSHGSRIASPADSPPSSTLSTPMSSCWAEVFPASTVFTAGRSPGACVITGSAAEWRRLSVAICTAIPAVFAALHGCGRQHLPCIQRTDDFCGAGGWMTTSKKAAQPETRSFGNELRQQLKALLDGGQAHATFDQAVKDLPAKLQGVVPDGLPYSAWQLLEHLRLAQRDILDFSRNDDGSYRELKWPDEYWPKNPEPPGAQA